MTLLFSSIDSNWTVTSYQRSLKFLLVVLGLLVNQVAYPQAGRGSESLKELLEHSASDKQSAIEQTPRNLYVSKFVEEEEEYECLNCGASVDEDQVDYGNCVSCMYDF